MWNKCDSCAKSNVRYESTAFQTTDMDTVGIVPNDFHGDVPNAHSSRAPPVVLHFTDLVRLPGIERRLVIQICDPADSDWETLTGDVKVEAAAVR